MKKRYIYLIRHGETDANKNDIYQGKGLDPPLNETGERQAKLLAEFLASDYSKISKIVSSPAMRAQQTAYIIYQYVGVGIAIEDGLHEIDHGDWEGKTASEVAIKYPELAKKWWSCIDPLSINFPGGEKIKDAVDRIWATFLRILVTHKDKHLAIVAHGGTNAIILSKILEAKNFRNISQSNTAFNIIKQRDNIFKIKLVNSVAHLPKSAS